MMKDTSFMIRILLSNTQIEGCKMLIIGGATIVGM